MEFCSILLEIILLACSKMLFSNILKSVHVHRFWWTNFIAYSSISMTWRCHRIKSTVTITSTVKYCATVAKTLNISRDCGKVSGKTLYLNTTSQDKENKKITKFSFLFFQPCLNFCFICLCTEVYSYSIPALKYYNRITKTRKPKICLTAAGCIIQSW